MEATCPHCGKPIELVGAKELDEDFGINGNRLQHARQRGKFPTPWLDFPNRQVYLRSDIEAYVSEKGSEGAMKAIADLQAYIAGLPSSEADNVLRALSEARKK